MTNADGRLWVVAASVTFGWFAEVQGSGGADRSRSGGGGAPPWGATDPGPAALAEGGRDTRSGRFGDGVGGGWGGMGDAQPLGILKGLEKLRQQTVSI